MRNSVIMRLHRGLLLVALTIALVGTGFAHRVTTADDQVLAFVLATGATAADICDDATPGDDHRGPSCPACQIAGGADLPAANAATLPPDFARAAGIAVAPHGGLVGHRRDHSHVQQAPPAA
jgi:hypothetical protein